MCSYTCTFNTCECSYTVILHTDIIHILDQQFYIQRYKDNLIIKYNKLEIPTADFFECASSQYVSLLLVKVDRKGRKEYNISGELDEVLRPVTCSEDQSQEIKPRLHDVLDVRDEQEKVILIEGGPGMGKSTLAIKMCQCWGTGGVLTSYDLVILLALRDPQIQQSKSLHDILSTTDADKTLVEKILQFIETNKGKNVCFMLEGYDELPAELRESKNCIFNTLSKTLPNCTVIYTSRPNACDKKFCSLISRRVKILGFEEEHIYEYVDNAFKDNPDGAKMSSNLKLKLKYNPILKDLTKTPINIAIACNIFSVKSDLPDTLTELYEILCLQVILWHIRNRTDNEDGITALCGLNYLPDDIHNLFAQVCFIAYRGTIDDILIFSTKYLQKQKIFKGTINGLSLLMNAPITSVYGKERSYNFLHRTVQDFCAAWHIFKLSETDQLDCFNKYRFSSSFQYVWRFFSGLSKFDNNKLFKSMLPFRYINTQLKNIALFELIHFIYEAREENCDWSAVKEHIGNTIDLSYHKLDQVSYYALGYFLENYKGEIKKIDLSYCEITSECVDILRQALYRRFNENAEPSFFCIDISSVQDNSSNSIAILLKSCYPLYSLTASNCNLSNSIRPALKHLHSNITLNELVLRDASLNLLSIDFLSNALMINKTLKILNIGNNNIGDRGAKFFSLCRNICITDLIMWNCSVGPDGAVLIGTMVAHNPSIKCLRLGNNQIGNAGTKNLVHILKQSNSLQTLDLWGNNINYTGASYLKELITIDHSKICCLVLGANPLKDMGVACILQGVLDKQVVKQLDIRDTYITGSSSPKIAESLKVLETIRFTPPVECKCIARALASKAIVLRHMQLHNGNDEAYETVLEGLQTSCDLLHKLEFSRGDLRSRGIRYLTNLVEHSRNLKEIVLRWMDIVPLDYLLFASAFKINKSVEKLSITPLDSQDNDHDFTEEFLRRLKINLTLKVLVLNVKVEHTRVYDNNAECTFISKINQFIEEINTFRKSYKAAPLILHLAST